MTSQREQHLSPHALSTRRIPELDGIRGLAILLVLLWHYLGAILRPESGALAECVVAWLNIAWGGVDVFFVLSGFLIGGILLDHRGQPGYFTAFYARRFCRILPPYVLLLVAFVLLRGISGLFPADTFHWLLWRPMPLWSYGLYLQNFAMAGLGTFGANTVAITWSLAVEEQFYLVLPLALFIIPPDRLRRFLPLLILSAPIVRLVLSYTVWPGWFAGYVVCRWDSLLLGVLGAMLLRNEKSNQWLRTHPGALRWSLLMFLLSIAVLVSMRLASFHSHRMNVLGYTWLGCGALILLLAGVLQSSQRLSAWLRTPWLRRLGTISYGVYLYHQGVLGLCHGLLRGHGPEIRTVGDGLATVLALGITLVLAVVSWEFMEKHIVAKARAVRYEDPPSAVLAPRWLSPGGSRTGPAAASAPALPSSTLSRQPAPKIRVNAA